MCQFALPGHRVWARVVRGHVGHRIGDLFAVAVPQTANRVMAGDRVQPRAKSVGFTQTSQPCRGDAEGVLHAVGCGVRVSDHPDAEVIKTVGIPVIDFSERLTITLRGGTRQITVADVAPKRDCSGHGEIPLRLITRRA